MSTWHHIMHYFKRPSLALGALLVLLTLALPDPSYAAANPTLNMPTPEGTCTTSPQFDLKQNYIVSGIANDITSSLYESIQSFSPTGMGTAAAAMATLYILMYGVMFMFGAVNLSVYDFAGRMAKVAVVGTIAAGNDKVIDMMYSFFEEGTDDIITALTGGSLPLQAIDRMVDYIVSPKMVITLATIATTGVYGPFLFLVLLASFKSVAQAMLQAVWVYLLSQVVRAILYAVAPIFIPCILFRYTYNFFQGWLNQIVNACLQPIFLFAYFSFFINMIGNVVYNIVSVPICLTQMPDTALGSPVNTYWWRFTVNNQQYTGEWGVNGAEIGGQIFPVSIFSIFIFFILADLVGRFSSVVISLANSISGATTNLSAISSMFSGWPGAGGGSGGGSGGGGGGGQGKGASAASGGGNPAAPPPQGKARPITAGGSVDAPSFRFSDRDGTHQAPKFEEAGTKQPSSGTTSTSRTQSAVQKPVEPRGGK
jgi:type IV secretory pathway VirB6-like protein